MRIIIENLESLDNALYNFSIRDPALKAGWIKLERPETNTFVGFGLKKPPLLQSSISDHFYVVTKILLSPISGVVGFVHGGVRFIATAITSLWDLVKGDLSNAKHQGKHALKGLKRMATSIGCAIPFFNLIGINFVLKRDEDQYRDALLAVQKMRSQQVLDPLLEQTRETPPEFVKQFKDNLNSLVKYFKQAWELRKITGVHVNVNNTTFWYKGPQDQEYQKFPKGAYSIEFLGDQQNIGHLLKLMHSDTIVMGQFSTFLNVGDDVLARPIFFNEAMLSASLSKNPITHSIQTITVQFKTTLLACDLIYHKSNVERIPYDRLSGTISFTLKLDENYLIEEVQDYKSSLTTYL
jgi:hypothetical protein